MHKTISVYHSSVPNKKSQEKIDLLINFSEGAKYCGEVVHDVYDFNYRPTDVAIIQGWIGEGIPTSNHLRLRQTVIRSQIAAGKYVVAVDSNLFLYSNKENPLHYLRYSFNGVFPNTGIYCDSMIDPLRWRKISSDLKISIKDYKTNGSHILLCLQRNGGWSMGSYDVQEWTIKTVNEIRKYSDRPIVIRPHPGDKAARDYLNPRSPNFKLKHLPNVGISDVSRSLLEDLDGAWAVVNHNSSPVVGAAIEGYPIFVTDPARSQCREIANFDLSNIENPERPDRELWVQRISMFHWKFEELRSGECWSHMKNFI